jgi:hypothetical protein
MRFVRRPAREGDTVTRQVVLLNSDKPEVLRALATRTDVRVRVIAARRYASLYGDHETAFVDSFEDLGQVRDAAYELARGGPVDHVLAATEKAVLPGGLVRGLLGVPGPTFDQSLWATHKRAMKDRLRAVGVPVTPHAQAATVDEVPRAATATGWPVMIKPVFGSGSTCTHRVDSVEAFTELHRVGTFDDLAARQVPVQVERLVRFESEYHCDGVLYRGEVHRAAVSRYFVPPLQIPRDLDCSYVMEQRGPVVDGVVDLHRRVVAMLGLTDGVTHLEVFGTGEGLRVGEVAIRPGGLGISRMWWHAFGIDLWEEFVRVGLGEPPSEPAPGRRPTVVGRTQLPPLPGIVEGALAVPGVVEVRPPEQSGTGNIEAFFGADDHAGADDINTSLHSLPGLPVRTGRLR